MSFLMGQGQTLVCLGDSITQADPGYVSLMAALIAAKYPGRALRVVNAGIGGHKAPDMLARLHRDVIAHNPDWVTINVGINDVWHGLDGPNGVPLDVYKPTMEKIVQTLQEETAAQIVLVTPTVIGEDVDEPANKTLAQYVAAMEGIATQYGTLLAPTRADFLRTLRAGRAADLAFRMTTDGVHLNDIGNARMALTILETLKF